MISTPIDSRTVCCKACCHKMTSRFPPINANALRLTLLRPFKETDHGRRPTGLPGDDRRIRHRHARPDPRTRPCDDKKNQPEEEVGAAEDLMREHGVLNRILLIYEDGLRRLRAKEDVPPDVF